MITNQLVRVDIEQESPNKQLPHRDLLLRKNTRLGPLLEVKDFSPPRQGFST